MKKLIVKLLLIVVLLVPLSKAQAGEINCNSPIKVKEGYLALGVGYKVNTKSFNTSLELGQVTVSEHQNWLLGIGLTDIFSCYNFRTDRLTTDYQYHQYSSGDPQSKNGNKYGIKGRMYDELYPDDNSFGSGHKYGIKGKMYNPEPAEDPTTSEVVKERHATTIRIKKGNEYGVYGKFGIEIFKNKGLFINGLGGFSYSKTEKSRIDQNLELETYNVSKSTSNQFLGMYGVGISYLPNDSKLYVQVDWDNRRGCTAAVGWRWLF